MNRTDSRSRNQQSLRHLVEDPRNRARWARRSRRRAAVAVLGVLTLLSSTLFALMPLFPGILSYLLLGGFGVTALLSVYAGTQINIAARFVPPVYQGLDEFQRAEADHATLLGHRVTAVLLAALVAVTAAIGGLLTSLDLSVNVVVAVLLPLVLITVVCHAIFPAAYLAWTRPDEVLDDED